MKKGVIGLLGMVVGMTAGALAMKRLSGKALGIKDTQVDKFKGYYNILNQWMLLKQEGKSLEKYFTDKGYKTVAIYGMGELGNHLYDELNGLSNVEVKYAIDKNAVSTYSELDVKGLDEELEKVDVVVVTATFAFDEIYDQISDIIDADIISLDDVIFDV